jgi:hypothetical protein
MRHYCFILLFLAMLCCSGHAFGQATQWLDTGGNCTDGFYYGPSSYAQCGTYGASVYGYFPVSAFALYYCGLDAYVGAFANVSSGGGDYPDLETANSELAYNGTDPGFDDGFEIFLDANGEGYSEGGGWWICAIFGGG